MDTEKPSTRQKRDRAPSARRVLYYPDFFSIMRKTPLFGYVIVDSYVTDSRMDQRNERVFSGAERKVGVRLKKLAWRKPGRGIAGNRSWPLGGLQLEERIHPPELPACKLQRRIQHGQAYTVFGLHRCRCMYVFWAPKNKVALVVCALRIRKTALKDEGHLCSPVRVLWNPSTRLYVIERKLMLWIACLYIADTQGRILPSSN